MRYVLIQDFFDAVSNLNDARDFISTSTLCITLALSIPLVRKTTYVGMKTFITDSTPTTAYPTCSKMKNENKCIILPAQQDTTH